MATNPKGLAVKIQQRLGAEITRACTGTLVPDEFLAGLIGIENARLDPNASRFEAGTYLNLKKLRNPIIFWRKSWNGITQADLKGASDEALINLATSFGYTQIMGWWSIHLKCTVADIRDPQKHLGIAVRLLHRVAGRQLKDQTFGPVFRIWNTGQPNGKTYDPDYVANGVAVMRAYGALAH